MINLLTQCITDSLSNSKLECLNQRPFIYQKKSYPGIWLDKGWKELRRNCEKTKDGGRSCFEGGRVVLCFLVEAAGDDVVKRHRLLTHEMVLLARIRQRLAELAR